MFLVNCLLLKPIANGSQILRFKNKHILNGLIVTFLPSLMIWSRHLIGCTKCSICWSRIQMIVNFLLDLNGTRQSSSVRIIVFRADSSEVNTEAEAPKWERASSSGHRNTSISPRSLFMWICIAYRMREKLLKVYSIKGSSDVRRQIFTHV